MTVKSLTLPGNFPTSRLYTDFSVHLSCIISIDRAFKAGEHMRLSKTCISWVVYRMTIPKQTICGNVVCEQSEWEALELARPGYHVLIHTGIKTEQEAEKLARGTAGNSFRSKTGKNPPKNSPSPTSIHAPAQPTH